MSETKWVNPHQPQTLYMGVILCYVMAVSGLLFGVGGPRTATPVPVRRAPAAA